MKVKNLATGVISELPEGFPIPAGFEAVSGKTFTVKAVKERIAGWVNDMPKQMYTILDVVPSKTEAGKKAGVELLFLQGADGKEYICSNSMFTVEACASLKIERTAEVITFPETLSFGVIDKAIVA